jgi:TonB dependent receptor.
MGAKYTKYIVTPYEDSAKVDTAGQVGLPDLRYNPFIRWGKGDWGVSLTGFHMEGQRSTVDETDTIGDHFEMNLSVTYQLPWDASLALGAINLTDEAPEVNGDIYGWEPFDFTLYDTRGRTVFLSYQQSL